MRTGYIRKRSTKDTIHETLKHSSQSDWGQTVDPDADLGVSGV